MGFEYHSLNPNTAFNVDYISYRAHDLRNFNDLYYMQETEELLKVSIINIMRSSIFQINLISLNESKVSYFFQDIFTKMEINLKLMFSFLIMHFINFLV